MRWRRKSSISTTNNLYASSRSLVGPGLSGPHVSGFGWEQLLCCQFLLEAERPRRPVHSPFFPLPLIRPLTNGGFSPPSSRRMPQHRLFLGLTVTIQIEGKRAVATLDSSSRTSSAPLMLLPEDLILHILILHIEDPHGMAASHWFARLRHVYAMFRQICDSPEVLCRLQLQGIRQYLRRWPGDSWTRFRIACASPVIARPSASLGCR